MVDRVKYFLLGLLFLLVAGVIAYDRWNSPATPESFGDNSARVDIDGSAPPTIDVPFVPQDDRQPDRKEPVDKLEPVEDEPIPAKKKPEPIKKKPAEQKPDRFHIVKAGESLERIALQYYNTRAGVVWIVDANGLKNRNVIFQNQKLIIPARKELTKKAPVKKAPASKVPSRYTVKSGDGDLYAICRRFYGASGQGARIARIMEMNALLSADVKSGTVLKLPPK